MFQSVTKEVIPGCVGFLFNYVVFSVEISRAFKSAFVICRLNKNTSEMDNVDADDDTSTKDAKKEADNAKASAAKYRFKCARKLVCYSC